jgi:hypothetical protein
MARPQLLRARGRVSCKTFVYILTHEMKKNWELLSKTEKLDFSGLTFVLKH